MGKKYFNISSHVSTLLRSNSRAGSLVPLLSPFFRKGCGLSCCTYCSHHIFLNFQYRMVIVMTDTILPFLIHLGGIYGNTAPLSMLRHTYYTAVKHTHTHTSCFIIKTSSCKSRAGSVLLLALNDPGSVSDSTSGHQIHLNVAQWGNGGHIMRR